MALAANREALILSPALNMHIVPVITRQVHSVMEVKRDRDKPGCNHRGRERTGCSTARNSTSRFRPARVMGFTAAL